MSRSKKSAVVRDLDERIILDSAALMAATTWSKSTLRRAIRGELGFRNAFPQPFRLGAVKNNYWRREDIE